MCDSHHLWNNLLHTFHISASRCRRARWWSLPGWLWGNSKCRPLPWPGSYLQRGRDGVQTAAKLKTASGALMSSHRGTSWCRWLQILTFCQGWVCSERSVGRRWWGEGSCLGTCGCFWSDDMPEVTKEGGHVQRGFFFKNIRFWQIQEITAWIKVTLTRQSVSLGPVQPAAHCLWQQSLGEGPLHRWQLAQFTRVTLDEEHKEPAAWASQTFLIKNHTVQSDCDLNSHVWQSCGVFPQHFPLHSGEQLGPLPGRKQ